MSAVPAGGWRAAVEAGVLDLWYGRPDASLPRRAARTLARSLLAPVSLLAARVAASRRRRIDRQPDPLRPPIVVVGNLVAGGAGKTPVVVALALAMRARGFTPGLLARGWRAHSDAPRLVGPNDDAADAGDEPLLLARATGCPVAVGADRAAALALLTAKEPRVDLVISDDGLQHVRLPRDLEIAVFDARGAGNGRLLPAGPLREPLSALAGMDAVLLNGLQASPVPHPHVFRSRLAVAGVKPVALSRDAAEGTRAGTGAPATATTAEPLEAFARRARGARIVALAGIGAPQRFFDLLASAGVACERTIALPDHAEIPAALIASIEADLVLMTEKDAVKCEAYADRRCFALAVRAELEPALLDFVESRVRSR